MTFILRSCAPAALALALAACTESPRSPPPRLDRFHFPTGLAVRTEPAGCVNGTDASGLDVPGCQTQLFVVSSNFDLRYDANLGGSLLVVDPDASSLPQSPTTLTVLGRTAIGSFGGMLRLAESVAAGPAAPGSCPGLPTPFALVASRDRNVLFRVAFTQGVAAPLADPNGAETGMVSCGPGCEVPLAAEVADAFDVAVVCPPEGPKEAYVTHLRGRDENGALSRVNLDDGSVTRLVLGLGPTQALAWNEVARRLFVLTRFAQAGQMPLRWLEPALVELPQSARGQLAYVPGQEIDLDDLVRGADPRAVALSRDGRRAFVGVRLYDAETAASSGFRPSNDVGSALAVLDLSEDARGRPAMRLVRLVFLERGPSDVRLLSPRTAPVAGGGTRALGELVAVTATDGDVLYLYDDETGAVVNAIGLRQRGQLALGDQPFGITVERRLEGGATVDRIYVGAFENHEVRVVDVDPANPGAAPVLRRPLSGGQP